MIEYKHGAKDANQIAYEYNQALRQGYWQFALTIRAYNQDLDEYFEEEDRHLALEGIHWPGEEVKE